MSDLVSASVTHWMYSFLASITSGLSWPSKYTPFWCRLNVKPSLQIQLFPVSSWITWLGSLLCVRCVSSSSFTHSVLSCYACPWHKHSSDIKSRLRLKLLLIVKYPRCWWRLLLVMIVATVTGTVCNCRLTGQPVFGMYTTDSRVRIRSRNGT